MCMQAWRWHALQQSRMLSSQDWSHVGSHPTSHPKTCDLDYCKSCKADRLHVPAGMVLASFPAIQDAVVAEMTAAGLPAKPLTYETARHLRYLEAVVKEVMRQWPIVPMGESCALWPALSFACQKLPASC